MFLVYHVWFSFFDHSGGKLSLHFLSSQQNVRRITRLYLRFCSGAPNSPLETDHGQNCCSDCIFLDFQGEIWADNCRDFFKQHKNTDKTHFQIYPNAMQNSNVLILIRQCLTFRVGAQAHSAQPVAPSTSRAWFKGSEDLKYEKSMGDIKILLPRPWPHVSQLCKQRPKKNACAMEKFKGLCGFREFRIWKSDAIPSTPKECGDALLVSHPMANPRISPFSCTFHHLIPPPCHCKTGRSKAPKFEIVPLWKLT